MSLWQHYDKVITRMQADICRLIEEKTEWKFLSLDHVDNDGAEHRRKIGQSRIYEWAEDNGYPDNLQLLCYNCNMAKAFYGKCPHQE